MASLAPMSLLAARMKHITFPDASTTGTGSERIAAMASVLTRRCMSVSVPSMSATTALI